LTVLSEEKEKEKRKLNLIVHRIPESTSEDALERKEHDIEQVNSVFRDYLKVDVEVDSAMRLGKKDPPKTRFLKIQVQTSTKIRYKNQFRYKNPMDGFTGCQQTHPLDFGPKVQVP